MAKVIGATANTKQTYVRNWIGTQWISALTRGGREWPMKKNETLSESEWKDTLDPQTQEWFEDRLDILSSQDFVKYLVYQIEKTDDKPLHYQMYIEFNTPKTVSWINKWLHRTTNFDRRKGKRDVARHYAMKGSCGNPSCAETWKSHGDRQCFEFASEVIQNFREYGVWTADGQRSDIERLTSILDVSSTWGQVIRNKDISLELAKFMSFAKEYFAAKPFTVLDLELNYWQSKLNDELTEDPDDRKIIWYCDEIGSTGKSTMTKYLVRNHDAIMVSGAKKDILHAYDNQRIIIFDLSRTAEGKVSYSAMEDLKDGVYFVSKYSSRMCVREHNAHLVVFANWLPDMNALSADRWDIRVLDDMVMIP